MGSGALSHNREAKKEGQTWFLVGGTVGQTCAIELLEDGWFVLILKLQAI